MSTMEAVPGLTARIESSCGELDHLAREIADGGDAHAAASYSTVWRSIHDTAESMNIRGLTEITEFVAFNAEHLAAACRDSSAEPKQVLAIQGVVPALNRFLHSPFDADALGNLIQYLQQPDWPVPMGENQAYTVMGRLLEQLQDEPPTDDTGSVETEDEQAADGYRLNLPEDVHPQLAEAFFNEVPQLAEEFTGCIQQLAEGEGREVLLGAQRLAHTIKGSANVTGVPAVATLMHACEDLLETLYGEHLLPDAPLAQILMESADCLASQLEYLQGAGPAPENARELVSALRSHQPGVDVPTAAPAARDNREEDVASATAPPAQGATSPVSPSAMRVSTALIEELLRQAGEVSISTVQLQGLSDSLSERLETLIKQQALMWEHLSTMQELVEMRSVSTPRSVAAGQDMEESVFDSLEMDEYNELHTATSFLAESTTDSREYTLQLRDEFNRLKSMLKQQDVLSRELNESVMGTRMVPFRSIVPRLSRAVRQTARTTGKSVELEIHGEDVQVDSAVLNRLTDPLMHIMRNAVDHGIEPAAERIEHGKSAAGTITVRAERYGDNVSLLIHDDGRGLDYDRIRRAALSRGLVDVDPDDLSEQDLARLILLPGFSTREEATQISGRGIGLDVVNTAVMDQRGLLDVHSEPGAGTDVLIRVPMTLISVHTLLVRNAGVVLGVPSSSVQQLIYSDLGRWEQDDGKPVFLFEDRAHNVVSMSALVGIDSPMPELNDARPIPLLLVQGEREPYAVVLEEVLDSRYLVVKRLGRYVPQVPGVIGGAILGDGSVAGVVDVREMLRAQPDGLPGKLRNIGAVSSVDRERKLPLVMIVDDSVSARRSLSELVSDAGYRTSTAIDGLAALSRIDEEKPAAVLLDMEMPRMNGLELTAHLRADTGTANIPLIMITSRSTEKHRRQAELAGVDRYFTKPYQEDALVDELRRLIQ